MAWDCMGNKQTNIATHVVLFTERNISSFCAEGRRKEGAGVHLVCGLAKLYKLQQFV
jgi:hypothetical protein